MNPEISRHFLFRNADALLAAMLGFLAIYLFTKHGGIGISPDSIVYTSVARHFHEGKGLTEFSNEPVVDFPVMYPIFLSTIIFISGLDVIVFAPILNSLLFAIAIFLSGYIMENFVNRSKVYKRILLGCIVISPTLLEVYSMLWSETLFLIWTLLFFITLKNYFRHHSVSSLLLMSLIAALAFDTRYAGITCIGTGGLLLLFDKNINLVKKLAHLLIFGTISTSLLFLNLMRNSLATGQLAGMRQKSNTPLSLNIEYFGGVVYDWLAFFNNHHAFALLIGIIVLAIFVLLFIVRIRSRLNYESYENISAAFFVIYASFILISSTLSRYETINSRLLSPALIPFFWGITYKIPAWISAIKTPLSKWTAKILLLAIVASFFTIQVVANKDNYDNINESGVPGYTEDIWKQSPIILYIKKDTALFNPHNLIYSNTNHVIYFYTNKITESLPERVHYQEVNEFYKENNYYLIWFDTDINPDLLDLKEIDRRKKMTLLHSFSDGAIYYCTDDSTTVK
jgi:hypothetical protein